MSIRRSRTKGEKGPVFELAPEGPCNTVITDEAGNPLPLTQEEALARVNASVEKGELICAVFVTESDDLDVQVYGEPTRELAEALLRAGVAFKRLVEGG